MLFFQAWKRVNQFDDLCNSHVFLEYKITRNWIYMCKPNISFLGCCLVAHCRLVDHKSASLCFQKKIAHEIIPSQTVTTLESVEPVDIPLIHTNPPLRRCVPACTAYHLAFWKTSRDAEMILFGPPPNQPHLEVFGCIGFVRETRGTMLGWFRTAMRVRFSVKTKISTRKTNDTLLHLHSWWIFPLVLSLKKYVWTVNILN